MLHLTSIRRPDVGPSEAANLANRIDRGDLSFHDFHADCGDPREMRRSLSNAREKDLVIQALRAFG